MFNLVGPDERHSAQRTVAIFSFIRKEIGCFDGENRLKREFRGGFIAATASSIDEKPLDAASILVIPDEDEGCELNLRNMVRSRRL